MKVGEQVWASHETEWMPGEILEPLQDGWFLVEFPPDGWLAKQVPVHESDLAHRHETPLGGMTRIRKFMDGCRAALDAGEYDLAMQFAKRCDEIMAGLVEQWSTP
jgi:hypothetical protein